MRLIGRRHLKLPTSLARRSTVAIHLCVRQTQTVSLDDRPEYESLSYAWGAPIFDKGLSIKDSVDGIVRGLRVRGFDDKTTAGSLVAADPTLAVTTRPSRDTSLILSHAPIILGRSQC